MLILFTATIFLGSLLLFLVQPMIGRMLLPLLGGAPAVWNTALVFYQAMLLAGYAYAHVSTRWLGTRRQVVWHILLLLLPVLVLPIGIQRGWTPPTTCNPIPWLLALLTATVGLPFFVVSATSPLLQRWFSAGRHRDAADPYFLYAASNCGSLLALVSYPVLIEPHLRLSQQSRWWAVGYGVLAALTAFCGRSVWHAVREDAAPAGTPIDAAAGPLPARRRWRWLLLAFVPSSLMLSVTTYLTSEVAPIPLLWMIPLGIYLLTFILVFAKKRVLPQRWMVHLMPLMVLALVMMLARMIGKAESFKALGWPIALHCAGLFVVAMVCHGELADDRPPPVRLTEFYLWISVGGMLGGMFNALLAPLIFPTILEYPGMLLLACALMPRRGSEASRWRARAWDAVLPLLLGLLTAGLVLLAGRPTGSPGLTLALAYGLPPMLCLGFRRRPLRFAFGVLTILLATTMALRPGAHTVLVARSFFGVLRVESFPGQADLHILRHGTTWHGMQNVDPWAQREPLLFYTKTGPLGQTMAALPSELKRRVAAVGLGAGTAACYGEAGQEWTFYEIDPRVERIARDPRYFTYLQDCPAAVTVVLGDARLSLQKATDGRFGLMILDAYNSDTVPLHLVTREALALYRRKLMPDGVLAFHITNRRLDLKPVLTRLAQDAGLLALASRDSVTPQDFQRAGKLYSSWVVMTRNLPYLRMLAADHRWEPPSLQDGVGVWTDDYASLFSVFKIWR